jgi:hypothetical protein
MLLGVNLGVNSIRQVRGRHRVSPVHSVDGVVDLIGQDGGEFLVLLPLYNSRESR